VNQAQKVDEKMVSYVYFSITINPILSWTRAFDWSDFYYCAINRSIRSKSKGNFCLAHKDHS